MSDDHALEIDGISMSKIDNFDCKTHIENRIMKIIKSTLVFMKTEKISANLFMLKRQTLQYIDFSIRKTTISLHIYRKKFQFRNPKLHQCSG